MPIIFITIGMSAWLIVVIWITVNGLVGASQAGYSYLLIYFMFFVGTPLSLLSSLFVPPMVLGWLRERRLRRVRRFRR